MHDNKKSLADTVFSDYIPDIVEYNNTVSGWVSVN